MLSKIISFENVVKLKYFLEKFIIRKKSRISISTADKIYIFLAADYGNLGDVAITYAQTKFLKLNFPDHEIIEIPISKTIEGVYTIQRSIKDSDIITIVGGGNFGNRYSQIEYLRQFVVSKFPRNKIVSFPQTFDFTEDDLGREKLKVAKHVYSNHGNIILVAREQRSYELMRGAFPETRVLLCPDIVFSLNEDQESLVRKGLIICMRDDSEKLLTNSEQEKIETIVSSYFNDISYYDTHIGRSNLSIADRNVELRKIWTAFKGAELVVTDRLHGMIFCFITQTPCLVFFNNNHKIENSYEWINDSEYIKLFRKISLEDIHSFLRSRDTLVIKRNKLLKSEYDPLIHSIGN